MYAELKVSLIQLKVTFGVISTIFMTRIQNSTLINYGKYMLGITIYKQNRKYVHATGAIFT